MAVHLTKPNSWTLFDLTLKRLGTVGNFIVTIRDPAGHVVLRKIVTSQNVEKMFGDVMEALWSQTK